MKSLTFDETVDGKFYWLAGMKFVRDVVVEREETKIRSIRRSYTKDQFEHLAEKYGAKIIGPIELTENQGDTHNESKK